MAFKQPTWEYTFVSLTHDEDRMGTINKYGAEGWEIIHFEVDHGMWYVFMKRRTS